MEILLGLLVSLVLTSAVLLVHLYKAIRAGNKRLPLPPGPPGLPIVGNLFDIPRTTPWIGYRDMSKKYGSLMCLRALGRTVIVIGDARTAVDLLEKRSVTYADRPVLNVVRLTGWDWNFVFARYGQRWRERRRMFWQYFRPDAVCNYRERQRDGVQRLLSGLLASPQKLSEHLRFSLTAIVLGSIYGMEIAEEDPHIATFEKGLESIEFLISSSLLEYVPAIVGRVPAWLPGTGVLRRVAEIREAVSSIRNTPWGYSKDASRTGDRQHCIAHSIIERLSHAEDEVNLAHAQEDIAKDAAGTAYAAAVDTQFATLQRFFVAMSLYPDVQRKAQAELEQVIGQNRMPEAEDRDRLPYVNALIKETLRWYPALPTGVARSALTDDEYNGYRIPKGATVILNAWAIMHDDKVYPDPERFSPERFLKDGAVDPEVMDPASLVFGIGRRICPGRYFADTTMFALIASVLHSFEISPRLDDDGRPVATRPHAATGIISRFEDWHCTVKPRSSLETEI
ncbi:cytochrome P450 [Polyporus arcularius HHB13444]|uniref:Cytochrome P450 n=1 Tax=Polyporus arcularius HHB13444 TaxID=1314778 RepID=A0A5C3NSV6_9APHY|nr:cytochrome P450 [Polyporus arcularius HHB13444]